MGNSVVVEVLERYMANGPFEVGRDDSASKEGVNVRPHNRSSASVKGKKEIARTKVTKWNVKEIAGSSGKFLVNNSLKWSSLNTIGERNTSPDQFQFSATGQAEVGKQSQRQSGYGRQRIDGGSNNHEPNLGEDSHPMVADSGEYLEVAPPNTINSSFTQEEPSGVILGEKDANWSHQHQDYSGNHTNSRVQRISSGEGNEYGCASTHANFVPRNGENKGDIGDDGMELEEGSGAPTLH
nr:hypothetical protein CFP56_74935 [Quercus suber]